MPDAPTTARARARAAMTADIKAIARRHLAEAGADGLSLRAVARELGVVSSAVYRYFPSRDDLLTALIIDAYDAVGIVAEEAASAECSARDRWRRVAVAVRGWAQANPHDYALVYGTPVPGYRAPQDTVDPAQRVNIAAMGVVVAGLASGEVAAGEAIDLPPAVRADLEVIREATGLRVPDQVLCRMLAAWTWLLGHVSYELFGHLRGGITAEDEFFAAQLEAATDLLFGGPA